MLLEEFTLRVEKKRKILCLMILGSHAVSTFSECGLGVFCGDFTLFGQTAYFCKFNQHNTAALELENQKHMELIVNPQS